MSATSVDIFYDKITQILSILDTVNEISLHVWAVDHLRRILVLVEANYFENEVTEIMENFLRMQAKNPMVEAFSLKAMERKYYTYFDWNNHQNVNNFFALFGDEFKAKACDDVKNSTDLNGAIVAFLEIGATRNQLIHNKLHEVSIPKTADEYYALYRQALLFIDYLKQTLK